MDLITVGVGLLVIAIAMMGLIIATSENKTTLDEMIEDNAPDYIVDYEVMRRDMENSRRGS